MSGVDVDIALRAPKADFGQLSFGLQGTYYIQWDQQPPDVIHLAGQYAGNVLLVSRSRALPRAGFRAGSIMPILELELRAVAGDA